MCDTDMLTFPALFVRMLTLKKNLFPCKFLCRGEVGKGWRVGALISPILLEVCRDGFEKCELRGSYHKSNLAGWGAVLCQRSYVGHACICVK